MGDIDDFESELHTTYEKMIRDMEIENFNYDLDNILSEDKEERKIEKQTEPLFVLQISNLS